MVKLKVNLGNLVEDAWEVCRDTAYTAGFALSYFGLAYIDEHFFGSDLPLDPEISTFAIFAGQYLCFWGTLIKGFCTACNTLKIPAKLITGKYFKKIKV